MPNGGYLLPPRASDVYVREVGDEIVAINSTTRQAHAMSGLVAQVFRASATGTWIGPVDDEFHVALESLVRVDLLVPSQGLSRRRVLQGIGAATVVGGLASVGLHAIDAAASLNSGTPVISLSPTSGPRGTVITVTGSNFATSGSQKIQSVTIGGVTVTPSNTTITNTGTFSFTITVPNNQPLGSNVVTVTDNHHNSASATFTVTAPTVTLTPSTVGKGNSPATVAVSGSGFFPGDTVTITNTGTDTFTPTPNTLTASGTGQISGNISVAYGSGNRDGQLTFTDQHGNVATATIIAR